MGVAVGNVGMNADELRSTFTAECYTAVHLVRSQSAGRTAWWPSTSWSLCLKKNWNNVKWGCPGNEASLWVSNILGFFCFFFLFTFIELWWVDSDTQCGERTLEASCTSIYPKALAHQKHHGVCCLSRVDDNASCTSTYISDINLAVSWLFCFMIFEKIHSF